MSTNRNRATLKKAQTGREYNLLQMSYLNGNCRICQKRAGSPYANCDGTKRYGYHGTGKPIYAYNYRAYRTWKHNRKTKWKE